MRSYLWLCVLSLVTTVFAAPVDTATGDSPVATGPRELTPKEFSAMSGNYFVKFYSPYCSHCKQFAPKWEAAFNAVGDSPRLKWASVDCIENGDLCGAEKIGVYPTIRVYRDGRRSYDYSTSDVTEEDLRVFAMQFLKRGDAALSSAYEKATPELIAEVGLPPALDNATPSDSDTANSVDSVSVDSVFADPVLAVHPAADPATADPAALDSDHAAAHSGPSSADPAHIPADLDLSAETTSNDLVKDSSNEPVNNKVGEAAIAPLSTASDVRILSPKDFGADNNVGRWFILFVGPDCEECDSMRPKWERHDNFARDIPEINWGVVDCNDHGALCEAENVDHIPKMRIYQDGLYLYEYNGAKDTMSLRTFLKRAALLTDFHDFSLSDLDASAVGVDGKPLPEGAGPNQEPQYMSGPTVPKPNHGKGKPAIADVVKYTLDTLGQPIDEDPGLLIFGESPERHHNFRTWGAPNAPPPSFFPEGTAASISLGKVRELKGTELEDSVKGSGEPWFVKFYSPKCPHCQALAPVFEEFAAQTKGRLNAGAINCDLNAKLCEAEKVDHYPLMRYYRGPVALEEYTGPRTVEALIDYALKVSKAQITPIESYDDIAEVIQTNFDKNLTTFVYLYDESVMVEDWESLAKVAINIGEWGGKLYRSNSAEVRELAGINHRGTAFALVEEAGLPGTNLTWYDFPLSMIPSKIRDSKLVSQWAQRSKWSQLQPLDPIEQSAYASYVAVKLTSGTAESPHLDDQIMEHRVMADELRGFYRDRQIQDQDRMRIDRLKQHDAALHQSKFKYALSLMKQKVEAPFIADLAFAYVPIQHWKEEYSKYIDTSKHDVGHVVIVDFYHGLYIDEFNLVPIQDDREVFDDLVDFLHRYEAHDSKAVFKSIRHFKTKMSGVPVSVHRSQKFHAKQLDQSVIWPISIAALALKVVGGLVAIHLFYRAFIRSRLRSYFERRRRNSFSGSSLFPKQE